MSLSQPAYRAARPLAGGARPAPALEPPRDNVGRLMLIGADIIAVLGALFVVSLLTDSDIRWMVFPLLPVFVLMAKMGGLYDRDQHVLHKTTLDEGSALLSVAAIFALVVEGLRGRRLRRSLAALPAVGRPDRRAGRSRAGDRAVPARAADAARAPARHRRRRGRDARAAQARLRPGAQRDRRRPARPASACRRHAATVRACSASVQELPQRPRRAPHRARDRRADPRGRRGRRRRHPRGQGLRREGRRAAAPARGDRLLRRVRRPQRPGAAQRPRLRALAVLADPQARAGPRRRGRRAHPARPRSCSSIAAARRA